MNSSGRFGANGGAGLRICLLTWAAFLGGAGMVGAPAASAQVTAAADAGGLHIFAGGTGSAFAIGYGARTMEGVSALVDVDSRRSMGLEAEARWLIFHQTEDVHATTWLAGPRYRRSRGKLQVYAKAMAGMGDFNYPYNYAHGRYLVVAMGGGADFALTPRVRLRLADAEYQEWPQFTFNAMTAYGVSAGIRVRVF